MFTPVPMARQPRHHLDKVIEGRRLEHLLNTHEDCPHPKIASNYIYGVIQQKYATNRIEVLQIINRLTARDRREFALPGRW